MPLSRFAGMFNANEYYYGGPGGPPPLVVNVTNGVAGVTALQLEFGGIALNDGTQPVPLNVNAPINVGIGANLELVTPTAVSNATPFAYGSSSVTANFANVHGVGDLISSGSNGLQEAINAANAAGGGTVIIDGRWTQNGGTQAMVAAATVPASVTVDDNRSGGQAIQTATINIPNAAVKTLFSVGTQLLPAPGA